MKAGKEGPMKKNFPSSFKIGSSTGMSDDKARMMFADKVSAMNMKSPMKLEDNPFDKDLEKVNKEIERLEKKYDEVFEKHNKMMDSRTMDYGTAEMNRIEKYYADEIKKAKEKKKAIKNKDILFTKPTPMLMKKGEPMKMKKGEPMKMKKESPDKMKKSAMKMKKESSMKMGHKSPKKMAKKAPMKMAKKSANKMNPGFDKLPKEVQAKIMKNKK